MKFFRSGKNAMKGLRGMPIINSNRVDTVAAGKLGASDAIELIKLIQEKTTQAVLFISEGFRTEMDECWIVAAQLADGNFALRYQPMFINEHGNYGFTSEFPLDVYSPVSREVANFWICTALDEEEDFWSDIHVQQLQRKDEFGEAAEIEKRDLRVKYIRHQVVVDGVPEDEAEIIAALTYP